MTPNPDPHNGPRRGRAKRFAPRAAWLGVVAAAAGLGAFAALTAGPWLFGARGQAGAATSVYQQLDLFGDVFSRVRANYVSEPEDEALIEAALNGMLTSLDPHSSYLSPRDHQEMRIRTRGRFGGLGIEFTLQNRLVRVITPIDDTPAQRAGILAGDLITHLDGDSILGMTLDGAVKRMRGDPGTRITLTVRRGRRTFDVDVVRAIIEIRAVRYEAIDRVGYVRVTAFNENAEENFRQAFQALEEDIEGGPVGYVVDLRNNPGGLLDQAVAMADALLDEGEIVSIRGRALRVARRHNARGGQIIARETPVILLINGGAASASEILAGALQDQRRAIALGTRSFGKGSVQSVTPLPSGGALKLTTALYYTPSGRSIQAEGVEPDILVEQPSPKGVRTERGESQLAGHIANPDEEEHESGSASYVPPERADDVQLNYAVRLLNEAWNAAQAVR